MARIPRSGNREAAVEMVYDSGTRRAWFRDVDRHGNHAAWRWQSMAERHLRPGVESLLFRYRRWCAQVEGAPSERRRRRQSLHRYNRRAEPGYGEEGLALSGY